MIFLLISSILVMAPDEPTYSVDSPDDWDYEDPKFYEEIPSDKWDIYEDNFDIDKTSPDQATDVIERYMEDLEESSSQDYSKMTDAEFREHSAKQRDMYYKMRDQSKKLTSAQIAKMPATQQAKLMSNYVGINTNPEIFRSYLQRPDGLNKPNIEHIGFAASTTLSKDGKSLVGPGARLDLTTLPEDVVGIASVGDIKTGTSFIISKKDGTKLDFFPDPDENVELSMSDSGDLMVGETAIRVPEGSKESRVSLEDGVIHFKSDKEGREITIPEGDAKGYILRTDKAGNFYLTREEKTEITNPDGSTAVSTRKTNEIAIKSYRTPLRIRKVGDNFHIEDTNEGIGGRKAIVKTFGTTEVEMGPGFISLRDPILDKKASIYLPMHHTSEDIGMYYNPENGDFHFMQEQGTFKANMENGGELRHTINTMKNAPRIRNYVFDNLGKGSANIERLVRSDFDKSLGYMDYGPNGGEEGTYYRKNWYMNGATINEGGSIKVNSPTFEGVVGPRDPLFKADISNAEVNFGVNGMGNEKSATHFLDVNSNQDDAEVYFGDPFLYGNKETAFERARDIGKTEEVTPASTNRVIVSEYYDYNTKSSKINVVATADGFDNTPANPLEVGIRSNGDSNTARAELVQGALMLEEDKGSNSITPSFEFKQNDEIFKNSYVRLSYEDQNGNQMDSFMAGRENGGEYMYKVHENSPIPPAGFEKYLSEKYLLDPYKGQQIKGFRPIEITDYVNAKAPHLRTEVSYDYGWDDVEVNIKLGEGDNQREIILKGPASGHISAGAWEYFGANSDKATFGQGAVMEVYDKSGNLISKQDIGGSQWWYKDGKTYAELLAVGNTKAVGSDAVIRNIGRIDIVTGEEGLESVNVDDHLIRVYDTPEGTDIETFTTDQGVQVRKYRISGKAEETMGVYGIDLNARGKTYTDGKLDTESKEDFKLRGTFGAGETSEGFRPILDLPDVAVKKRGDLPSLPGLGNVEEAEFQGSVRGEMYDNYKLFDYKGGLEFSTGQGSVTVNSFEGDVEMRTHEDFDFTTTAGDTTVRKLQDGQMRTAAFIQSVSAEGGYNNMEVRLDEGSAQGITLFNTKDGSEVLTVTDSTIAPDSYYNFNTGIGEIPQFSGNFRDDEGRKGSFLIDNIFTSKDMKITKMPDGSGKVYRLRKVPNPILYTDDYMGPREPEYLYDVEEVGRVSPELMKHVDESSGRFFKTEDIDIAWKRTSDGKVTEDAEIKVPNLVYDPNNNQIMSFDESRIHLNYPEARGEVTIEPGPFAGNIQETLEGGTTKLMLGSFPITAFTPSDRVEGALEKHQVTTTGPVDVGISLIYDKDDKAYKFDLKGLGVPEARAEFNKLMTGDENTNPQYEVWVQDGRARAGDIAGLIRTMANNPDSLNRFMVEMATNKPIDGKYWIDTSYTKALAVAREQDLPLFFNKAIVRSEKEFGEDARVAAQALAAAHTMDDYIGLDKQGKLGITRNWEDISGLKTRIYSREDLETMHRDLLKKEAIVSGSQLTSSSTGRQGPLFVNVLDSERSWRTPEDHINKALDYVVDRDTWTFKKDVTLLDLISAEDQLRRAQMRENHEIYADEIAKLRRLIEEKKKSIN